MGRATEDKADGHAMTTLERLRDWQQAGVITGDQHRALAALASGQRMSVYVELHSLLYLGVVSFVVGLGWTFQQYFTNLGDPFILATFTLLVAACLYYCFAYGRPYSHAEVESPNLAFDYVLYFACLVLTAELAYVEFRFHLFRGVWDNYLLFTTAAYALLAYRFDNRFVLSLALAAFAGWFGLKVSTLAFRTPDALRASALVYGALITAAGAGLHRRGIKPHFLDAFLQVAANVVFAAVVSGVGDRPLGLVYLAALLLLSAAAVVLGLRFKRFAYVAYGIVYGYAGFSYRFVSPMSDEKFVFGYFVVTGTAVIVSLVLLARRFARDEG
jgi:hypothetical protein